MDHQRDYRPPGDKLKPNVRPIEYQSDHQNDHIRIAPGRNQPELRIELSPHMDVHAEGSDEFSFDQTLQRSEEHTSELQSLMRISYAVFCLKKNNINSISATEMSLSHMTIVQDRQQR